MNFSVWNIAIENSNGHTWQKLKKSVKSSCYRAENLRVQLKNYRGNIRTEVYEGCRTSQD